MLRYAAYGSNLHPERLQRRIPSARLLGTARVRGWSMRFNKSGRDGSGKCNIVRADDAIHVAVFAMTAGQRPILDRIEGLNRGYRAAELDVPGYGLCFSYRAEDAHVDDVLAPYSWYKALVVAGCELHRFPRRYVRNIRDVGQARDPDIARHGRHMRIVTAARRYTGLRR